MTRIHWIPFLFLLALTACGGDVSQNESKVSLSGPPITKSIVHDEIQYTEFKPDAAGSIRIKGFNVAEAYAIHSNKIVTGHYEPVDGKITFPDSEKDYGMRLMQLDGANKIMFKSPGAGDVYQYEPHFFKSDQNDKIIVVCQLGFEYSCGGDAFLLENGKVKYMGYLDIESNNMNQNMVEIIRIKEKKNQLVFSFEKDSLLLSPGGENELLILNNDVHYTYDHQGLQFHHEFPR